MLVLQHLPRSSRSRDRHRRRVTASRSRHSSPATACRPVRRRHDLAHIGEFLLHHRRIAVASGGGGPISRPWRSPSSALTALLTPWLIGAAPAFASWVDRNLPRPLQNFRRDLRLVDRERAAAPGAARRGGTRAARRGGLLAIDAALLVAITLAALIEGGPLERWLVARLRHRRRRARAVVRGRRGGSRRPFVIVILGSSGNLGRSLAARAVSRVPPRPPAIRGRAEARTWSSRSSSQRWRHRFLLAAVTHRAPRRARDLAARRADRRPSQCASARDARNPSGHTRAGGRGDRRRAHAPRQPALAGAYAGGAPFRTRHASRQRSARHAGRAREDALERAYRWCPDSDSRARAPRPGAPRSAAPSPAGTARAAPARPSPHSSGAPISSSSRTATSPPVRRPRRPRRHRRLPWQWLVRRCWEW